MADSADQSSPKAPRTFTDVKDADFEELRNDARPEDERSRSGSGASPKNNEKQA